MKYFWSILILAGAVFVEATFFTLPLVMLCLLLLGVLYRKQWIFAAAFLAGIVLDVLLFQTIGESSIFFLVMLGIIFLYQRKFEIHSIPFIAVFSFIASVFFGVLFGSQHALLGALVSAGIAAGVFFLLSFFDSKIFFAFPPAKNYLR